MRETTYKDGRGRKYLVLLPDHAPESEARHGIKIGPPDLDLDIPSALHTRLHNELYHRGLFTLADVKRRRRDVVGALQAAIGLDVEAIVRSYQNQDLRDGLSTLTTTG